MTLVFIFLTLLLLLIGVPVAFALGTVPVIVLALQRGVGNIPFGVIAQQVTLGVNSFIVLAIPLFLFTGAIMNRGGITMRIFRFANCLVGHVQGGLGHVNVLASMIFAGMSGTALADVAGLGQIEIKAMKDNGYDPEFAAGITGASSIIGPIIPPSVPMVIYGVLAGVSVGRLFVGGIIPGLLLALSMMVYTWFVARKKKYPLLERPKLKDVIASFREAFLSLLTPVIIVGGIVSGVFTPTEAAGVAALYSVIIIFFVYKELTLKELWEIIINVVKDSSMLLLILASGTFFGWLLVRMMIPYKMAEFMTSLSSNPLTILFILTGFLIIVGCFMSVTVALNILVPILVPIIVAVGIDPLHFGLIMILTLTMGVLTPPFGFVLFALMEVADLTFDRILKGLLPFFIPIVIVILLIILIPQLTTYLPSVLM